MVCRTRAVGSLFCTRTPQNAFVRSFVCFFASFAGQTSHFAAENGRLYVSPRETGQHDAHLAQQHHQAGAAGGKEGQADAGVRDGVGDHGNVQHRLQGHLHHEPHHQQCPEAVRRAWAASVTPRSSSRLNSRITAQAPTNPSSSHRMEKMKSFWGSGTNRCFWRLLPSPSPTAPPEADGVQALDGLVTVAQRVGKGVQPGAQAAGRIRHQIRHDDDGRPDGTRSAHTRPARTTAARCRPRT